MLMRHLMSIGPFALLFATFAHAQDTKLADPLTIIPPKAVAVIQVNGVERVQERLQALLKKAVPDQADDVARLVRSWLADALGGRDLKALRPDGRVIVAFSDLEKLPDDITVSFLFPASNADDFRKKFLTEEERKTLKKDSDLESVQWEDRPGRYYLVNLAGYVAVCSDKETARIYAKGNLKGISAHLSPESARTFLDSDVSVFVNVQEITAKYGAQLKRYKSVVELFLKGDTIAGVSKTTIDQIRGMVGAAFHVLEDGTAGVLGVELQPEGVRLKALAQFGEKTPTAATLGKSRPVSLARLGTLPSGQVSYSASALGPIAAETSTLLLGAFSASDTDPTAKETIDGLLRALAAHDRNVTLSAGRMLASGGLEVTESKDAERIVADRLAVLNSLTKTGTFANVPLKAKPQIAEKAEQIGALALHAAHLKFDLDKAVLDLPNDVKESTKASIRRAVGEEMHLWFGSDGKQVVQVIAKDWADAKSLVESFLNGTTSLATDDSFQFTRKQLPAEANMLIVLDAARSASTLLGVFGGTAGSPPPEAAPASKPAYIGLALVLKERHAAIEVFIPAAAVEQIRKALQPLLDRKD
jgi:hypothetical protein